MTAQVAQDLVNTVTVGGVEQPIPSCINACSLDS
jgi:hypothetical protein